jgi:type VI secretion system ImpA family protein
MLLDVEALLAPVSEDDPVGPDLDYDPEREPIRAAFETAISSDETDEAETDWRDVIRQIEQQSEKTKDVWLAVYLARAGARSGQIEVVEAGVQYLAGLLERYWDNVHPQLEEAGFQGRKGPCESLTRVGEFLGPLRRTVLLSHPRLGEYSGADFERFREGAEGEDGYGLFRAALEDLGPDSLELALARIDAILDGLRRVDAVLTDNAGDETGTNFTPAYDALNAIRRAVAQFAPGHAAAPEDEETAEGSAVAPSASGGSFSGRIDSREDVLRAMDAIADYYRRREPGSPVPFALARARDWVNADFLTVLEDIAPGGMDEVRRVLTKQSGQSSDYGSYEE